MRSGARWSALVIVTLCCSALAAGAWAQTSLDDALQARAMLEALMAESKGFVSRDWPTEPSPNRRLFLDTPVRSSDQPGVCEYDTLEIILAEPGAAASPNAPRVRSVKTERQFSLMAIRSRDSWSALQRVEQDNECRTKAPRAKTWEEEGAHYDNSTDAATVWLAGQALEQLAAGLVKQICPREDRCPPANLLSVDRWAAAVESYDECKSQMTCLRLAIRADGPNGGLWWADVQGRYQGVVKPPKFTRVEWRYTPPLYFD